MPRSKRRRRILAEATATAAQIGDKVLQTSAYLSIAEARWKAGDVTGSRRGLELAQAAAEKINEKGAKASAYYDVVETQAKIGDIAGAGATATKIRDSLPHALGYYEAALHEIAKAQLMAGDLAGAEATAAQVGNTSLGKVQVYCWIAAAGTRAGDLVGRARAWNRPRRQRRSFATRAQRRRRIASSLEPRRTLAMPVAPRPRQPRSAMRGPRRPPSYGSPRPRSRRPIWPRRARTWTWPKRRQDESTTSSRGCRPIWGSSRHGPRRET